MAPRVTRGIILKLKIAYTNRILFFSEIFKSSFRAKFDLSDLTISQLSNYRETASVTFHMCSEKLFGPSRNQVILKNFIVSSSRII